VPISSLFVCGYFYFKKMKKNDWVGKKVDMLTITQNIDCEFVIASCDCGSGERRYRKNKFRKKFFKSCGCARIKDETGETYGPFFIIKDRVGKTSSRSNVCQARCNCGNVFETETRQIVRGKIKSCGCRGVANETGNTYGVLKVIKDGLFKTGTRRKKCVAECFCGKIFETYTRNIVEGNSKSCGCVKSMNIDMDPNIFNVPNCENLYWAGFIAADGCIGIDAVKIDLSIKDVEHLRKIKGWINSGTDIKTPPKRKSCSFNIHNHKVRLDLKQYGITPRKSLTYSPPAFCIESIDFWRGMVDGDGFVSSGKRAAIGLCGTIDTCTGFKAFVSEFCESKANVYRNGPIFAISYSGKYAIQIMRKLYGNNPKFYLDRKYALANKFCNFPLADDNIII